MKRYLHILFLLLAMLTAACSQEQAHDHAADGTTYTCPMHPQIVQDGPGTCPICGMDLVPTSVEGGEVELTEDLDPLLQRTNSVVISSVSTTTPERKSTEATVEMEGIITYDPNQVFTVPSRVAGRIEQLYVKYAFQPVKKGQKLLEIYSPELVTAQKELLYLVHSAPEDRELIEAAKQKLRLLGATDAQISRLLRTGEASFTFAIHSPYNGYVIGLSASEPAVAPGQAGTASGGAGGTMDGMAGGTRGSTAPPAAPGQDIQLREGMYVSAGQPLLQVMDPSQLWAEFNVPPAQASQLATGAPVQISFPQIPGTTVEGKIDFLQPFFEQGENFAKIRVYLPGNQKLAMVGQLVRAHAAYSTDPSLWVPRAAVLDLGTRSVAFRKVNGAFQPVTVTAGITQGGETQILEGLQPADTIAANAQYLVDSESFISVNK
jgi:Cu(I)/Ag(I) efflux system membrane fusion protein